MQEDHADEEALSVLADPVDRPTSLYLYGLVDEPLAFVPGCVGLENAMVSCLPFDGVGALVHSCPATPYASTERQTVVQWAQAHAAVLCDALARYPSVVPFAFNTIVRGPRPEQRLAQWINEHRANVDYLLGRLRGRVEYGVRLEPTVFPIPEQTKEDRDVPAGIAYILQGRSRPKTWPPALRHAAQSAMDRLVALCDEVRGGRTLEPESDGCAVFRLACLVDTRAIDAFINAVGQCREFEALRIEVTGPWPAYSFLDQPPPSRVEG